MLPQEFLNKMKASLKDEYSDYIASFNNESYKGLRINTSKISITEFLAKFPYQLQPIPWTSDGFYYTDEQVSKHPFYYAGLYYLQEPSAMLPAEVLPIEENDYVLDTCAAPGGKSSKLAIKLKTTGLLVSNDISSSRQNATLRNLERFGIANAYVTCEDVNKLAEKYPSYFDKILVDAPCSGEGMFRKDPSLINAWISKGPLYYAPIQKEIIIKAISMLKPGGKLVYSTCTFDENEDEQVIKYALENSDTKVLPIKQYEGFVSNEYGTKLYPHKVKGEGHFVSLLQKNGTKVKNTLLFNTEIPTYLNNLNIDFSRGRFECINNNLYFNQGFYTKGLRVLRSGLLLGELKNERFEPSQALAMALKDNEYTNTIDFKIDDPRVYKYLKGETINTSDHPNEGHVLIRVDKYPLGFAKINKGNFKNKIDKGWIYK